MLPQAFMARRANGGTMSGSSINAERSWLTTASERAVIGVAAATGAVVFIAISLADWLLYTAGLSPFGIMLIGAALAGVLAFTVTYRILNNWHERRETVRRELQIIGDTNHHIRNALELIQLSAQTTHDQQVIQQISIAVDRIQWVLRELLGEQTFCARGGNSQSEKENPRKKTIG